MQEKPVLVIFGGPNGSGKSTVREGFISKIPQYDINADDITRSKIKSGDFKSVDSKKLQEINLEAAKEADTLRTKAIKEGRSFTTESVMSTEKGINIMNAAKNNGFDVHLIYVMTDNPETNIKRIKERFAEGGHPVPEEKVISRYNRCMERLPKEIQIADSVKVYDNSSNEPSLIIEKTLDKEIRLYPQEPPSKWTLDRLEEIKTKVEEISRVEERASYPEERDHLEGAQTMTLYTAQPDRTYRGPMIAFQDDKAIQEISPGVGIGHDVDKLKEITKADIGKDFTISYDNKGDVSISREPQRDRGNEINR